MKPRVGFLAVVATLLFAAACKKQTVLCENGGSLVNNQCACINGYSGTHCEVPPATPNFSNTEELQGTYLVSGMEYFSGMYSDSAGYHFYEDTVMRNNDTLVVTKVDAVTLKIYGRNFVYYSGGSDANTGCFAFDYPVYFSDTVRFIKGNPLGIKVSTYYSAHFSTSWSGLSGYKID